MSRSLFGRFLLAFSIILLANLGLVMALTTQQAQVALQDEYRYRLSEAAERAVADYLRQGASWSGLPWTEETNNAASNLSGIYVAVYQAPTGQPSRAGWSDGQAGQIVGERLAQVLAGEQVYWAAGDRAYTAVPVQADQQSAVLLLGLPRQSAAGSLLRYGRTALYTLLAVSIPTLLLAFAFFRQITRPISRMAAMADAVAQGDFGQRVDYQAHDEIGALGSALNQMAKQLANAEQSRKTFLAGVSHELRTPLTTIKANTQAMLDQIISLEEQPEYLASTVEEIDRLRDMVDTLIQVAHPGEQRAPGRAEVDLSALLSDTVRQTVLHAGQSAVCMRTELPGGLITWGDAGQLRQVFLNVLDNAIRFSPPGGEISIALNVVGTNLQTLVTDQGCGISGGILERLFQPFVKAPDSPGAGLGLYLCRQLVQAHGGSISILSREGEGSVVTILLPQFGGLK